MSSSITKPRRRIPRPSAVLGILVLAFLAAACSGSGEAETETFEYTQSVNVVTTLYPLEYFAQRVGGELVVSENLVSPGVQPHDFAPTPEHIRKLDAADVILYNGSRFEPWMDRALEAISSNGGTVVEVSQGLITTRSEEDSSDEQLGEAHDIDPDPHWWLDPLGAVEHVRAIRIGLAHVDLASALVYARNAESLIEDLERLHDRFVLGLSTCRLRQFVATHAAFGHLAKRYGLEQVAISGLSPEAEPSPDDLAALVDTVAELGVKYVMAEPIVDSRLAETLAAEVGASLLTLHPLENLTVDEAERGETYFSLMEKNLSSLATALECN